MVNARVVLYLFLRQSPCGFILTTLFCCHDQTNLQIQALDMYDNVERSIGADGYTLTATIDVLHRMREWRRALSLLERLAGLGVPPERGLRTAMNAVLAAMGPDNYVHARELVERAADEWGVTGDFATYGTLLLSASNQLPPPPPLSPALEAGASSPSPEEGVLLLGAEGDGDGGRAGGRAAAAVPTAQRLGVWETVRILRLAVAVKAVPSESCLNMAMFGLARNGSWEEASAFVEAVARAGLRVSRNQVGWSRICFAVCIAQGDWWRSVVRYCCGKLFLGAAR